MAGKYFFKNDLGDRNKNGTKGFVCIGAELRIITFI